jgi:putative ABC transport system ATP-binding protein
MGVNLTVRRGEFVALMGESGSGKSTLLNLITGIDRPDSGLVRVGGKDLTALGDGELSVFRRQRVGFVFQFFNLLPNLTVHENVAVPLMLKSALGSMEDRVRELLAEVGLETRGAGPVHELSGGEQQRVAIARALVHDPDIIVADEPTGSLDRANGDRILGLIRELAHSSGKTVIMATHSGRVARAADRTVIISDGRIMQERTTHERTMEPNDAGTAE